MSKSGREVQSLEKLVLSVKAKQKRDMEGIDQIGDSQISVREVSRPRSDHLDCSRVNVPAREKDILSAHGFSFQNIVEDANCGKVYKVTDRRNGKFKAVRVHHLENATFASPNYLKAVRNEINILIHIRHENIIRMFANFQYHAKHYVVVDYMEKGSLADYMKEHRLFPSPAERKSIFQQLLSALKYCLEVNLVHHDLKLKNILLDKNNHIKLCGFGRSLPWASEQGDIQLCADYDVDLEYAAPEVLAWTPYDPRPVDVWALGVILYTLLCFEMPFGSINGNPNRLLKFQKSRKVRKRIGKKAPPEESPCIRVILDMLEPDVTQRVTLSAVLTCDWLSEGGYQSCDNTGTSNAETDSPQQALRDMFKE